MVMYMYTDTSQQIWFSMKSIPLKSFIFTVIELQTNKGYRIRIISKAAPNDPNAESEAIPKTVSWKIQYISPKRYLKIVQCTHLVRQNCLLSYEISLAMKSWSISINSFSITFAPTGKALIPTSSNKKFCATINTQNTCKTKTCNLGLLFSDLCMVVFYQKSLKLSSQILSVHIKMLLIEDNTNEALTVNPSKSNITRG